MHKQIDDSARRGMRSLDSDSGEKVEAKSQKSRIQCAANERHRNCISISRPERQSSSPKNERIANQKQFS